MNRLLQALCALIIWHDFRYYYENDGINASGGYRCRYCKLQK